VLASEVLREEEAPFEPAQRESRWVLTGVAMALVVLGVALRLGAGVPAERIGGATVSFATAASLVVLALLPFPYSLRAALAATLGLALVALGVRGTGPLAGFTVDGGWQRDLIRVAAGAGVAAAIWFRGSYRHYRPALLVLALAVAAAAPYAALGLSLASESAAPGVVRWASASCSAGVVLCGLLGFMPHITKGWGAALGIAAIALVSLDLGVRQLCFLACPDAGTWTYPLTAGGAACACLLVALGSFQLLAAACAGRARISLQRAPAEIPEEELEQRISVG
jgi:hypothetical protein